MNDNQEQNKSESTTQQQKAIVGIQQKNKNPEFQRELQLKEKALQKHDERFHGNLDPASNTSIQLKSYSKEVTVKEKIDRTDDWNEIRRKLDGIEKGGDAGNIGKNVNKSLADLGIQKGSAMSAHQIPNRIGGAGGASDNVRPWNKEFESGKWEEQVEKVFDKELVDADVGAKVSYNVTTTDMDDTIAQEYIDMSSITLEKAKAHHKDRIKQIPLAVTATVGSKTLVNNNECFTGLFPEKTT